MVEAEETAETNVIKEREAIPEESDFLHASDIIRILFWFSRNIRAVEMTAMIPLL